MFRNMTKRAVASGTRVALLATIGAVTAGALLPYLRWVL